MGLEHEKGDTITGIKARMKGAQSRVTVGIMGELDAVICRDHPDADPETGAAHCCGHNAQIASMLGAAMGLADSGAMAFLGGDVALLAVPAEEGSDPGHLSKLMQEGKITGPAGNRSLSSRGSRRCRHGHDGSYRPNEPCHYGRGCNRQRIQDGCWRRPHRLVAETC